jgi:hypothetical protein
MLHIAATGQKAGQWVNCPAKIQCKIGGTHASDNAIRLVHDWKNDNTESYVPKKALTLNDYQEFKALPQETQESYAQALQEKTEEYNLPENKAKREAARLKAHRKLESNKTPEQKAADRQAIQTVINMHNAASSHKIEAREPLTKAEAKVTATTVEFKNGFVGERALYKPETVKTAREIQAASVEVLKTFKERALTIQEADKYLNKLKEKKYYKDGPLISSFRAALLTEPSKRELFDTILGHSCITHVVERSTDYALGYKAGTAKGYREYGNEKQEPSNDKKVSQPKETFTTPMDALLNKIGGFLDKRKLAKKA